MMGDLSNVRRHWDERRAIEGELLRRMTIEESVAELDYLYRSTSWDALHDQEKTDSLVALQSRLRRLGRGQPR